MKKLNLKLYESPYPLQDTNSMWADVDENTGELRAIHKYNKSKGEWEPNMVSVDYISTGNANIAHIYPINDVWVETKQNSFSGETYSFIQIVIPDLPDTEKQFIHEIGRLGSITNNTYFYDNLHQAATISTETQYLTLFLNCVQTLIDIFNSEQNSYGVLNIVTSEDELLLTDSTMHYGKDINERMISSGSKAFGYCKVMFYKVNQNI